MCTKSVQSKTQPQRQKETRREDGLKSEGQRKDSIGKEPKFFIHKGSQSKELSCKVPDGQGCMLGFVMGYWAFG